MSKELIFYTNPRSRGGIVHWMLEEIGCPYRIEIKEYGTTMKAPDYLAINPMGKVPAIKHGDTVVTETAAILAYLADAFPEARLAPAPAERGEYYRWLFFGRAAWNPAMTNHAVGWDPSTPELQGRCGYGSFARVMDTLAGCAQRQNLHRRRPLQRRRHLSGLHAEFRHDVRHDRKTPRVRSLLRRLDEPSAAIRAREKAEKLANQKASPAD